jgi:hypothetical protein
VARRHGLTHAILWRRLDAPGHEAVRLTREADRWRLAGSAVFAYETRPCRLDYVVTCDARWHTLSAKVSGWVGDATVDVEVTADAARTWRLNGVDCPAVAGCIDVDLNFSPATNTLPIRRLDLALGHESAVRAAWLRFPGFTLEPLAQLYRRTSDASYRYESDGGRFTADVVVNAAGLVTRYPGLWIEER